MNDKPMLAPGPSPTHEVVRLPDGEPIAKSADVAKLTELAAWLNASRPVGDEAVSFEVRRRKRR